MSMSRPLLSLAAATALLASQAVQAADANALRAQAGAFFKPLPATMPGSENDTPAKIALGEKLYF